MELKQEEKENYEVEHEGSNRTFMELKRRIDWLIS